MRCILNLRISTDKVGSIRKPTVEKLDPIMIERFILAIADGSLPTWAFNEGGERHNDLSFLCLAFCIRFLFLSCLALALATLWHRRGPEQRPAPPFPRPV